MENSGSCRSLIETPFLPSRGAKRRAVGRTNCVRPRAEALDTAATLIVNADDERTAAIGRRFAGALNRVVSFGLDADAAPTEDQSSCCGTEKADTSSCCS